MTSTAPGPLRTQGQKILAALLPALALLSCGSKEPPIRPSQEYAFIPARNAVIYLVDTLRADHLGCYGYERNTSPRIDRFAAEGLLFENCIAQSTWTKPASASVLTGLYPSEHGMLSEAAVLPSSVQNIAGIIKGTPWASGAFAGNQYVFRPQGEMLRGFDVQRGFSNKEAPSYARAEEIIDAALGWIQEQADEPFVAYIHTVDPHAPYGGTEPFDRKFVDEAASDLDGLFVLQNSTDILDQLSSADIQRMMDLYDGDVAYTDHQFGRFLDRMTALGRDKDTMIIFVSDHGEEFNEHGDWQHNPKMHPEVIRIPLIVRMPVESNRGIRGRRVDLAAQVDIVPTLLDGLGFAIPVGLSGRSLFRDPGSDNPPTVFSEFEGEISLKAMVSRDFMYVRQWSPGSNQRLYDLQKDPDQRNNIAFDGTNRLQVFKQRMEAFIAKSSLGYSVLFQNPGSELLTIDCLLSAEAAFDRLGLFFADTKKRHGDLRDGPPQLSQVDGQYRATIRLFVAPGDGDGVTFIPGESGPSVSVNFLINGEPANHEYVRMGPQKLRVDGLPITITKEQAVALSAARAAPFDASVEDPYRILVWANLGMSTKHVPITADERSQLDALGYTGDE